MPTYEIHRNGSCPFRYTLHRMDSDSTTYPYSTVVSVTTTVRGAKWKARRDARKQAKVLVERFQV